MAYIMRPGFKNYVRNGDMGIYQRGAGPFTVTGDFTVDGFYQGFVGGTITTTRIAPVVGTSALLRTVTTGQTLASHYVQMNTAIEGISLFPTGKVLTLSFKAKATSGTPKIGIRLTAMQDYVGTGATDVFTSLVTLSTTLTTYIVPITIGSHSSSVGAGNHLRLTFWLSAGTNWTAPSGVGLNNNTFDITDVQLEDGPIPTPFERLPVEQQLAWCQRYFQRTYGVSWVALGYFDAYNAGKWFFQREYPVEMRASPTMSRSAALGDFLVYAGNAGEASTGVFTAISIAPDAQGVSNHGFTIASATYDPSTYGQACVLLINAATAYIELSAEI